MGSVTRILACFFLLAGSLLLGCTEATPNYCKSTGDCPEGRICDVERAVCSMPDASVGPLDGRPDGQPDGQPIDGPPAVEVEVGDTDAPRAIDVAATLDGAALDQALEAGEGLDGGAVDVEEPDVIVPDGAGTCGTNADCPDPSKPLCMGYLCVGCQAADAAVCGTQVCDVTSGRCVDCTADRHCGSEPAKGFCVDSTCKGCTALGATGCAGRANRKTVCATTGAAANQCVECAADADCGNLAKGFCVANACTGCQSAPATACSSRSAGKPVCAASGTLAGQCVECAVDGDCGDASKSFCVANACTGCQSAPATACSSRSTGKPVCAASGTLAGQCVECAADGDCGEVAKSFCVANACAGCQSAAKNACSVRAADLPVCATSGTLQGRCVACQVDADCTVAAAPICESNACTRCRTDAQCAAKLGANPGVCMAHQDGRCATDAETVYVASTSGCASSASGGTAAQPLCTLQSAVTLLGTDAGKRLIVLRSTADGIAVSGADQVSIVGQNAASIATGAGNPGIAVSGTGNLYARRSDVVGSSVSNAGISAGAGTTLALERVRVLGNGGGGILLAGAAFRLRDVLVHGNGTGSTARRPGAGSTSSLFPTRAPPPN